MGMCLSYVFAFSIAASLLLAFPVSGAESNATGHWSVPAAASVLSEQKRLMPKNTTQAVELLRFVTAYKKGVEALVDLTPYSALLRASSDTDGELTFFAFIDTWVGNNTPDTKPIMSLDSAGKCTETMQQQDAWGGGGEQGNGWQIDADLVFWPRNGFVDTRPRESITISSGYYGSYSIGSITTHEGKLSRGGASIELQGGADLTGAIDAHVYPCPGGAKDMEHGVKMGQMARRMHSYENSSDSLKPIIDDVYSQLASASASLVTVVSADVNKRLVQASFDTEAMHVELGMPVWYDNNDIQVQNGSSYGMFPDSEPIGTVVGVTTGRVTIKVTGSCLPGATAIRHLKMEKSPGALLTARKLADSMGTLSARNLVVPVEDDPENILAFLADNKRKVDAKHGGQVQKDVPDFHPFLLFNSNSTYCTMPVIGQIDLGFHQKEGAECTPVVLSLAQTSEHEVRNMAGKAQSAPPGFMDGSPSATAERLILQSSGFMQKLKPPSLNTTGHALQGVTMLRDGDKVCVLARRASGRVFERSFDLPSFLPGAIVAAAAGAATATQAARSIASAGPGDHVLLQLAVTGHGWSGSTEQCGEFCHAVYHISVNGKQAVNVTEWRDDCEKNPINGQQGTWEIARDGWCPGSVEPGLYIDITKWMKTGRNHIAVDLSIWSSKNRRYMKYTNYGGFNGNDGAMLFVGATMFVYDGAAVDAIRGQRASYTAAEAALRTGCSLPKALHPPEAVNSAFADSLLEKFTALFGNGTAASSTPSSVQRHGTMPAKHTGFLSNHAEDTQQGLNFHHNFEKRAPWYLYDEAKEGAPGSRAGAVVVPAFKNALIQINTREIRVKVKRRSFPEEWGSVAMHIRLGQPGLAGLEMDNWDRVGSLGLVFDENAATTKNPFTRVKLSPSSGPKLVTSWKLF